MTPTISRKPTLQIAAAAILGLAAAFVANSAERNGPSLKHGVPGSVHVDSIESLPMDAQRAVGHASLAGEPHIEPLLVQDVRRFSSYRERVMDSSLAIDKVKIALTSVHHSELATYQYVGFIPEGPRREGPWTSLTRVFLRPDGAPIFLYEWDFPADGGSVVVYKELVNEKVGDAPARLVVKRSSDGRAISEISWTTASRDMKLSAWGDVLRATPDHPYDKQWLMKVARSVGKP